jgi:predicted MPP superfamily phosphohydrolase
MRMIAFMVVMPLVWIGAHVYLDRRLVGHSPWPKRARHVTRAVIIAAAAGPVASMLLLRSGATGAWVNAIQLVGYMLMGLSSVALVMLFAVEIMRLVAWAWGRARLWLHRRGVAVAAVEAPSDPGRRGFFGQLAHMGVVGTASGVAGFGFHEARRTPDTVEVDVPIVGLPAALDGFRIVQLTDIHVGPTIRGEYLRRCVEVANGLEADIVAVTGDLVDGFVPMLRGDVAPLGELRAKEGVYFVTGNHEYYWDGPAWCAEVERLGLTVLCNEHRVIERDGARMLLAGVTDISAGTMVAEHASDPAKARAEAPDCDVRVLLAHQPRSVFAAAKAGYDLQISGHTHGGQYFPMNLLVYLAQPYVAGLERHDDMWIYVSRGTGYWGPPARLGAPAEITLLRLRTA